MTDAGVSDTDDLIIRALRGDAEAGGRLLDRHRDRLRRMIASRIDRRILGRVDPSDVVQETLAAAARGLPAYLRDRPLPFFAWLRQFARERLAKLHRHHIASRRRSVSREQQPYELPDDSVIALTERLATDGTSPSQGMIRDELRRGVRAALDCLSEADRELLLMRHVEQLPMADVAAGLGIGEGAARVRYIRAAPPPPRPPGKRDVMRASTITATFEHATDEVLAELVERYIERAHSGDPIDPEAFAAAHPGYSDSLRELLPVVSALARFDDPGRSGDRPTAALSPRRTLGDFRIVREIGRGGMGVVYEAEQVSTGRRVALKVLPEDAAGDPRPLARFRVEVHAASTLSHPNIVPIVAVGRDEGIDYFVMPFVGGRTLAQLVAEHRRDRERSGREGRSGLPPAELARLGLQAADALEHAHSMGILHRDVKPGNLMVDDAGHLWVVDFGLARIRAGGELTATGDVIGTLRYMSPEQALSRGMLGPRSDIYSLGATLYELLVLRPAIEGRDRHEILRRIADCQPTPPRRLDRTIPAELEVIVLKAMAREPADRYASAGEMADDLRQFLDGRPIRRVSPASPAVPSAACGDTAAPWPRRASCWRSPSAGSPPPTSCSGRNGPRLARISTSPSRPWDARSTSARRTWPRTPLAVAPSRNRCARPCRSMGDSPARTRGTFGPVARPDVPVVASATSMSSSGTSTTPRSPTVRATRCCPSSRPTARPGPPPRRARRAPQPPRKGGLPPGLQAVPRRSISGRSSPAAPPGDRSHAPGRLARRREVPPPLHAEQPLSRQRPAGPTLASRRGAIPAAPAR